MFQNKLKKRIIILQHGFYRLLNNLAGRLIMEKLFKQIKNRRNKKLNSFKLFQKEEL
jgi:hypothetical protein